MTDPTEEAAMPLDRSALDAGTEAIVDGGTITDSDDQWGPWVPIVPVTVPSVSPAPDATATATVPSLISNPDAPAITTVFSVSHNPDAPAITTVPSVSHNPDAPAITTVPSVATAMDAPATSPVPLLVTMPSAGSSMGPPAVAVPQIKYAARPGEGRLLDYASSLRLVSMSAPRFRGGPYGTTTTSSAAASSGGPTNLGGPISVPAWDQFSTASSSGLSPQEYAALNRMPMGSSEPEVREWPKFLRVRVSGDLNYTKVLTGNAAERSAGCIPLDYRPAPEVEAIPGPTVVGEKYLLVCERSLQLEREWAEAKLIVEGEYPTPPSYVNARVVPMQSLQVASVQTEPEVPSTMEVGTLTSDLELAHAKHSVMARIGTITLSTGIEVWMLQNFIRSLRGGMDALPKMHEARLLMECINMSRRYKETPQFRLETLSNRLVGDIEEGYSNYVALSNIPAQFTGSFVFQALYGDGQIRLRSSIRPSEPVRPRRQQPILAREGPVPGLEPPSGVVVATMTGPETMSAPDNASETGPQRFIGLPMPPPREVGPLPSRDPGFPPPVEGLSLSEQIGRYLSLTSLLSEQMRWYTTRGLVVPEWCARHISLLHRKIHELQQSFHIQQTGVPP